MANQVEDTDIDVALSESMQMQILQLLKEVRNSDTPNVVLKQLNLLGDCLDLLETLLRRANPQAVIPHRNIPAPIAEVEHRCQNWATQDLVNILLETYSRADNYKGGSEPLYRAAHAYRAEILRRIHEHTTLGAGDTVQIPLRTLYWWMELVSLNPRDLLPRIASYLPPTPAHSCAASTPSTASSAD